MNDSPSEQSTSNLLAGRTALITGGAAGIGKATAELFGEQGASVVIADIDANRGRALEEALNSSGRTALFVEADMANVSAVRHMIGQASEFTGRLDILVNNAAVTRPIPMLEITEQDWDWVMSVNLRGLFFCLQAAAEVMRKQQAGKIVNVSAISAKGAGGTANVAYAASKAAVNMITRSAAMILGGDNINVNTVCPGTTATPMLEAARQVNPNMHGRNAFAPVLGRISQPSAIANAILFLSSSMSDDITGQSINVDNGIVWD